MKNILGIIALLVIVSCSVAPVVRDAPLVDQVAFAFSELTEIANQTQAAYDSDLIDDDERQSTAKALRSAYTALSTANLYLCVPARVGCIPDNTGANAHLAAALQLITQLRVAYE